MARKAKSFSADPGYTIARLQAVQRGIYSDKDLSQKIRAELVSDLTAFIQKLQSIQIALIGENGGQKIGEPKTADSEVTRAT